MRKHRGVASALPANGLGPSLERYNLATCARGVGSAGNPNRVAIRAQIEPAGICGPRRALFAILRWCTNVRWCNKRRAISLLANSNIIALIERSYKRQTVVCR